MKWYKKQGTIQCFELINEGVISGECSDWAECVAKEEGGVWKSGCKHTGAEIVSDCTNDECFIY